MRTGCMGRVLACRKGAIVVLEYPSAAFPEDCDSSNLSEVDSAEKKIELTQKQID